MNNRKSKLPGIGTVYDVKKILEKKGWMGYGSQRARGKI